MDYTPPWNSPGKSTGMGSHPLLQKIFPTQGSNLDLPHCRQILYNYCFVLFDLFHLLPLTTTSLFSLPVTLVGGFGVFFVILFFTFHILNEFIWYLSFLVWHISLSMIPLRPSRLQMTRFSPFFSPTLCKLMALFSHKVMSDSLQTHGLQHTRLLCHSLLQSLLKFMSIESIMPSSHLILCCPLLLLPSIFPSIRVFANESALRIRWPKCWSFSFTISPSSEYSGLFSLRMDWFDLFAVEGTLKSLLQNHSSKASVLQCSAFFMAQLSHLYMTTEKTIALTIQIFVSKVVSMLFNALFRLVMDT